MRYFLLILFSAVCISGLVSQNDLEFSSPVKHPTRLSGSYGEPRSAHFHAGIDYKQYKGVPRDTIFAVGPGVISRINVHPDGYGNALYIDHPNGYTSVYAHLYDFNPTIRSLINKRLKKDKVHQAEYDAIKDSLVVEQGDYIGIMGNTGRSSAAHLHFEIRETKSEIPVNPSKFGFKPIDTQIPIVKGIMIYQIGPDAEIYSKKYYPVNLNSDSIYRPQPSLIEVGSVAIGIGIHCYDTMNGAKNHNGIYGMKTKLNGIDHFGFELNEISFDHTRYIHSHMDYDAKLKNRYVSKSFKTPNNPLQIYDSSLGSGFILPSEVAPSTVEVSVYDFDRNVAKVKLQLIRRETLDTLPAPYQTEFIRLSPLDTLSYNEGSIHVQFAQQSVDKPEYLRINQNAANEITLESDSEIAFFKYFKLSTQQYKKTDCQKCIYTGLNSKNEHISYGAKWENDTTLISYVNQIGTYQILSDTIKPDIKIVSLPTAQHDPLSFIISDNYVPSYKRDYLRFEVLINGEWVLCQHDIKTNKVWCRPTLKKGVNQITIRVKDAQDNIQTIHRVVEV